jgi:hypothetical protein
MVVPSCSLTNVPPATSILTGPAGGGAIVRVYAPEAFVVAVPMGDPVLVPLAGFTLIASTVDPTIGP